MGKRKTGLVFRFSIRLRSVQIKLLLAIGVVPELERRVLQDPARVIDLFESNWLTNESFADEEPLTGPLDLARAAYASDLETGGVFDLWNRLWVDARRPSIETTRWLQPVRFVRSKIVESCEEVVELRLLFGAVCCGRSTSEVFEISVHPFMSSVLIRLTRIDQEWRDAEAYPSHRQLRESSH